MDKRILSLGKWKITKEDKKKKPKLQSWYLCIQEPTAEEFKKMKASIDRVFKEQKLKHVGSLVFNHTRA